MCKQTHQKHTHAYMHTHKNTCTNTCTHTHKNTAHTQTYANTHAHTHTIMHTKTPRAYTHTHTSRTHHGFGPRIKNVVRDVERQGCTFTPGYRCRPCCSNMTLLLPLLKMALQLPSSEQVRRDVLDECHGQCVSTQPASTVLMTANRRVVGIRNTLTHIHSVRGTCVKCQRWWGKLVETPSPPAPPA